MAKRKRNPHSSKSAQTENKNGAGNNHLYKAILHAASSGWVQNSAIAALLLLAGLIVTMLFSPKDAKTAALTFGIVGTAAIWIFVFVAVRYGRENVERPSTITVQFSSVNASRILEKSGPFWLRYPSAKFGDTLSPLPVALNLRIHNNQAIPTTISELNVSLQAKGGDWRPLMHVDVRGKQVFWIYNNLKEARPLEDQSTQLDYLLDKPIGPSSDLIRWIYFNTTKPYPSSVGTYLRYKLSTKDTSGKSSEQITDFQEIKEEISPSQGFAQSVQIKVLGGIFDLSNCTVKFWDESLISPPPVI